MSTFDQCTKTLREQGKAYPRTCAVCGPGPCRRDPPKFRPILIGRAEEIPIIRPDVQRIIDNEGFWIATDIRQPNAEIPIVSMGGKIYAIRLDQELLPDRFFETAIFAGPFRGRFPGEVDGEHQKKVERQESLVAALWQFARDLETYPKDIGGTAGKMSSKAIGDALKKILGIFGQEEIDIQ